MILIAGPCVIEQDKHLDVIAKELRNILVDFPDIDFYFKASCVKDNRTKLDNYRGPGFNDGIRSLLKIKDKYNIKITTDFHDVSQIKEYAHNFDLIQIPAFLARQTSLLISAAKTNIPIHVKKPQYLNPAKISQIHDKIFQTNVDTKLFITDRGTCFGYDHWMFDPRHIRIMKNSDNNIKVLVDITHPNQEFKDYSYAYELGLSAIVSGADGLFLETHHNPAFATCDAINQIPLTVVGNYIRKFYKFYKFKQDFGDY